MEFIELNKKLLNLINTKQENSEEAEIASKEFDKLWYKLNNEEKETILKDENVIKVKEFWREKVKEIISLEIKKKREKFKNIIIGKAIKNLKGIDGKTLSKVVEEEIECISNLK